MKAMACKTSFELHHRFPKLAEESGFTFNTHRPRIHIDWNKITLTLHYIEMSLKQDTCPKPLPALLHLLAQNSTPKNFVIGPVKSPRYFVRLIDIETLIKERKFVIIEQHINDILDCVFESEFDVRILDEGVMKMFRLAQLTIEYQQFCRHYLDRSVYVLREEITSLAQELDTCKKHLLEKDEEIRRLKKRSRYSFKSPLPYGNENIATMILRSLSHKGDIFSSPSNDSMHYNKCNYCDKVFLNQLYLKSHLSRRHGNLTEAHQKDKTENITNNEHTKLSAEITELKNKITEMENIISSTKNQLSNWKCEDESKVPSTPLKEMKSIEKNTQELKKDVRDAEVSTNNEEYFLNKIEEWKKQEHENYNNEMHKLRIQILETINKIKEKENQETISTEPTLIMQLHETIKQQGAEILALKKELTDSKIKSEKDNIERNKDAEAQISFWTNRAEAQSKQYELLLQKMNDVAKDAKESRALAEAERERAAQLKIMLEQSLKCKKYEDATTDTPEKKPKDSLVRKKSVVMKPDPKNCELKADDNSLEKLHRKAQELLNIASISSSSSDTSEIKNNLNNKSSKSITNHEKGTYKIREVGGANVFNKPRKHDEKQPIKLDDLSPDNTTKVNSKRPKLKKEKLKVNHTASSKIKNGSALLPGSPVKLVRSKITEEVNTRLVSAGVDPLKTRLHQSSFQRQRMQLQQHRELKAKKNPAYNKVRHSILAFLDSSTTDFKKEINQDPQYISTTKVNKPFKNISSVISNVKTKALSLVKLNDAKEKQKLQNTEVAKRAISLLKTPPDSASNSPITTKRSSPKAYNITKNLRTLTKTDHDSKSTPKKVKNSLSPSKALQSDILTNESEDGSEEGDHEYHTSTTVQQSKSIENLIKSPARRPSSVSSNYNHTFQNYTTNNQNILRTQSATDLMDHNASNNNIKDQSIKLSSKKNNSSSELESYSDIPDKKIDEGVLKAKQTKSVLKSASSISSLNKKKVLFDMDAIQMKSLSASPSQSLTEKSDTNEKYALGLVSFDGEEWDISSIENEPLKNDTKIQSTTGTSPKIAELKNKIESQLARRNDTATTPLFGGVDVLGSSIVKPSSIGGSNTSLGSSILDDSESPIAKHKTIIKPKKKTGNDNSDIDVSELSISGIDNKNEYF